MSPKFFSKRSSIGSLADSPTGVLYPRKADLLQRRVSAFATLPNGRERSYFCAMDILLYSLGIFLVLGAPFWLRAHLRRRKRARLLAMPLSPEQRMALDRLVP